MWLRFLFRKVDQQTVFKDIVRHAGVPENRYPSYDQEKSWCIILSQTKTLKNYYLSFFFEEFVHLFHLFKFPKA